MNTIDCPEHETFQAALRGARVRYVLRARQQRNWRLLRANLDGVGVMTGREGAANVCSGAATAGNFNAFFSLDEGEPFTVDGHRLEGGKVAWMAPDCTFHCASSRPASWLRITLPIDMVTAWFASHEDECDAALLTGNRVEKSNLPAAPLIRLAHGMLELGQAGKKVERGDARKREARLDLLETALRTVVPVAGTRRESRHNRQVPHTLNRALAFIASRKEAQVRIEDLCRATGVSERTLRNVFYRNFGMSPHQYLMVGRLHDVRERLRTAGPGAKVSGICADFGIWDFGRFAGQYRGLFGVLPSQELAARRGATPQARPARTATRRSSVLRGYSPKQT
jgi:AraC family transcriptional regulator, ethanolamine operon transcriptional activator